MNGTITMTWLRPGNCRLACLKAGAGEGMASVLADATVAAEVQAFRRSACPSAGLSQGPAAWRQRWPCRAHHHPALALHLQADANRGIAHQGFA